MTRHFAACLLLVLTSRPASASSVVQTHLEDVRSVRVLIGALSREYNSVEVINETELQTRLASTVRAALGNLIADDETSKVLLVVEPSIRVVEGSGMVALSSTLALVEPARLMRLVDTTVQVTSWSHTWHAVALREEAAGEPRDMVRNQVELLCGLVREADRPPRSEQGSGSPRR